MFAGSLRIGSELSSDFGNPSGESVSNKNLSEGIYTRPEKYIYDNQYLYYSYLFLVSSAYIYI